MGAPQFLQTSGQQATVAVPALVLLVEKVRDAVCRFCLNLQVLPEFAGPCPFLGPSCFIPAASFKVNILASKSNFSGSDARKFPQSEAALQFGVQTAPQITVLWNDAWLGLLFLPAHLNRADIQSHQLLLGSPGGRLHHPSSEAELHLVSSLLILLLAACAGDLLPRMIITGRHGCAIYPRCAAVAVQIHRSAQLSSSHWLRPFEVWQRSPSPANS